MTQFKLLQACSLLLIDLLYLPWPYSTSFCRQILGCIVSTCYVLSLSLILMVRQENTINAQSFHTKGHTTCEAPRIPETISTRWSRQYMMKWWALINDKTQRNDWKGQVDVDVTVPTLLVKTFFAQLKRSSYQLKVTLKMEKQRVVVEIIRQWAYHPHYRHR